MPQKQSKQNNLLQIKRYKKLLKAVCDDPKTDKGLCYYITEELDICAYLDHEFAMALPELWAKRPEKRYECYEYWFPRTPAGWRKRIKILEEVIEKLESK